MDVTMSVDYVRMLEGVDRATKHMGFAIKNAINATMADVQTAERDDAARHLIIRKSDFFQRRLAVIKPFATIDALFSTIGPDLGRVQGAPLLLEQLELGGEKLPVTAGAANVAVPLKGEAARPSETDSVGRPFYYKTLNFKRARGWSDAHTGQSGEARRITLRSYGPGPLRGAHRTYVVPGVGVYMRMGPGKGNEQKIYAFEGSHVHIREHLQFIQVATRVAEAQFPRQLEAAVLAELLAAGLKVVRT